MNRAFLLMELKFEGDIQLINKNIQWEIINVMEADKSDGADIQSFHRSVYRIICRAGSYKGQ